MAGPSVRLVRAGASDPETLGSMTAFADGALIGPSIVGTIVAIPMHDGTREATSVELRDIVAGSTTTLTIPAGQRYVGHTGDGGILVDVTTETWTGTEYAKDLSLRAADGTLTRLMDVRARTNAVLADDAGILVTQYRFEGGGVNLGVTSAIRTVYVASKISASPSSATIRRGSSVRIAGNVWPAHAGQLVALQHLTGSGWRTVTWAKLTSTGYAFAVRPASRGTFRYRIYKPADADHAGAVGPTLTITVR
ncbi:MAG TPA: hypothetical protein VM841_03400 [Actinomycetota bacterium]|nr:hypothetical protein [Actinomycetota bacterium]